VELAGQGALAAALALALGDAAAGAGPGRPVMDLAEHHDGVQGAFSCRSPPRLRRWRTTWPEDAGTVAAPASMAKAASERNRPGWDQLISSWAALVGPIPGWGQQGRSHDHDELA
jgi:hypothetical protein